jgi:hypothetical protein
MPQTVSHVDFSDHDAPRGRPDDRAALQGYATRTGYRFTFGYTADDLETVREQGR